MRTLTEHLKMSINESFSSEIISTRISSLIRNGGNKIKSLFQWDKISDEDLEMLSTAEALQSARRRNSQEVIFWVSADKCIAITNGIHILAIDPSNYSIEKTLTANKLSKLSDYTFSLKDADRFNTISIKKMRAEAKQNALAFKTNEQVARENASRYEKAKALMNKGQKDDIIGWFDASMEIYQNTLSDIGSEIRDIINSDSLNSIYVYEINNQLDWLNSKINSMIFALASWTNWEAEMDRASKEGEEQTEWSAVVARKNYDNFVESCKDIKKYAEKIKASVLAE